MVCSIGICITSNADPVFPYTVPNWTWNNGGLITSDTVANQDFYAQQFEYNHSNLIPLTNTSGNLVSTKNYRILVNFTPQLTTGYAGVNADCSVVYSIICGGQVYEFGNSNWCYFDVSGVNTDYIVFQAHIYAAVNPSYTASGNTRPSFSYTLKINDFSYNVIETEGIANPDLNQINDTISDGNDIQQDIADTTSDMAEEQHDFFSGFFDSLFDTIYSLFIPDDDFFEDYFARVRTLFEVKLGALWFPVQWLIDFIGSLYVTSSSVTTTIPFPDIEWAGITVISGSDVRIIPAGFEDLQNRIFFVTDILMIGSIIMLLQTKIREVLEH